MVTTILPQGLMSETAKKRIQVYCLIGLALALSFAWIHGAQWQGSAYGQTLMEAVATLLAVMVGTTALLRYYSNRDNATLIIAAGFMGTALLDGYHFIITSVWFRSYFPQYLDSLSLWSEFAPRVFLAAYICLSVLIQRREQRLGRAIQVNERDVYTTTVGLVLLCFLFSIWVPLPRAYYTGLFSRPQELAPGFLLMFALAAYLKRERWRYNTFEHWFVMSMIINATAQVIFLAFSSRLFDVEFVAGHVLKNVSYLFVLIGLFISMYETLRQVELEVADRQRAELAREDSHIRYQMVNDTLLDGLVIASEQGIIESFNPAAEQLFGYTATEVLGKNVSLLTPEPHRSRHDAYVRHYLQTGEARVIGRGREVEGKRKDGSLFPLELSITEMRIGRRRLFSALLRDISERKAAEAKLYTREQALKRSNAELEKFAYVASHDLKEPLRKVRAFGDRLALHYQSALEAQGLDYLNRMQSAAERMGLLIDGLLTFSRVSTRGERFESIDLDRIMADVLSDLEICIAETGAKVEVVNLTKIEADPLQMRQIFQNLLGNALKFRKPNIPPVVRVKSEPFEEKTTSGLTALKCRIWFSDNGIGFDPRYAEKIFEVFQRLHGRDEYEGTGVGLAICRKIAERHGGSLTAASTPEGATFILTLKATHEA
jgi:two-component system sensor kinase FixL